MRILTTILCSVMLLACHRGAPEKQAKNIILMIGDGMGPQQVAQALLYEDQQPDSPGVFHQLFHDAPPVTVTTHSADSPVTDSAAAATAMACGIKTWNDMLGVAPDGTRCPSILARAKAAGKATGLVSNTRLSHATPGSFAAANISRSNENAIADQVIGEGQVDVHLDGGGRHLIPQGTRWSALPECTGIAPLIDGSSKRVDDRNLIAEAKTAGYQFACTAEQLRALRGTATSKVLGIFSNSSFPHVQEQRQAPTLPRLAEMTAAALEILARDPDGFFVMIEGGLIDYAGHENDAGTQLQETLDFAAAITVVREFVRSHPDTLLLVTADHETGGYSMSFQVYASPPASITIGTHGNFVPRYHSPTTNVVQRDAKQTASFMGILEPILAQLYPHEDPYQAQVEYAIAGAASELQSAVRTHTGYQLNPAQAAHILRRVPPTELHAGDAAPYPFCVSAEEQHSNKLSRVLSPQSFTTWATGNHTHIPVQLFVLGPHRTPIAGLLDNTDVYRIMAEAMP